MKNTFKSQLWSQVSAQYQLVYPQEVNRWRWSYSLASVAVIATLLLFLVPISSESRYRLHNHERLAMKGLAQLDAEVADISQEMEIADTNFDEYLLVLENL